ncbi:MAG TPA: type IX secretion system outer membrane channel protein PorV [Bacteroidetes bacterium]|nr:type IX secretion system outer membrane channel protein PorV [Bacteroidota bacterium]
MKFKINFLAFIALLLLVSNMHLSAQTTTAGTDVKAITTAVPFLMIAPDSRSGALGDAGVAIADNANATHWNLSSLAFTEKQFGVGLSYTPWLRQLVPDINLSYLSGFYNLGDRSGVIGASIRYFTLGKIEFTDENAVKYGEFNANEFAIDGGYTRKITDNFSAGVQLRFIYSNLAANARVGAFETKPGTSVAGDINMLYTNDFTAGPTPINIRWGLNISNIGAKISYTNSNNRDFIPTNLRFGILVKANMDEYNSIGITSDVNKLLVPTEGGQSNKTLINGMFSSFGDAPGGFSEELTEFNWSTGLEYWYNDLFAARAGLFLEHAEKGNRKFITLGAGVKYNVFALDFAYLASLQQAHPLQNTLRFSLSFEFDPSGTN